MTCDVHLSGGTDNSWKHVSFDGFIAGEKVVKNCSQSEDVCSGIFFELGDIVNASWCPFDFIRFWVGMRLQFDFIVKDLKNAPIHKGRTVFSYGDIRWGDIKMENVFFVGIETASQRFKKSSSL